jgi:hypothetical protein
MSRGLRNNNPGNIRLDGTKWRGEVHPSRDGAFKTFETMAWGYRAMFVVLNTYREKYGLRTIRQMVGRWAPPCENDTAAYVDAVARWSAVGADCRVDTTDSDAMMPIVAAMSRMENGTPAVMADIEEGWGLFQK